MNMEQELKKALQRVPAPSGFTDRAVARVKLTGGRSWSLPHIGRIAAAILFVATLGVSAYVYVEEQRAREGQQAREQLLMAMQITAEKADLARRAIHQ